MKIVSKSAYEYSTSTDAMADLERINEDGSIAIAALHKECELDRFSEESVGSYAGAVESEWSE